MTPYVWLTIATCVIGVGSGPLSPASRNAGLQLIPDESASLAALRSTGIEAGAIATISITSAVLAQAADPGGIQAVAFVGFAVFLLACMPIITRVPEHRGSW